MLAQTILVIFGVFLIGVAIVVFVRRPAAERFFNGFASSVQTHFAEQIVRMIVGVALVLHAEQMRLPPVFTVIGWLVVVTSIGLMCLPWRWHQRFAQRVIPVVIRYMAAYAVLSAAFGGLLIAAVVL